MRENAGEFDADDWTGVDVVVHVWVAGHEGVGVTDAVPFDALRHPARSVWG